MAYDFFLEGQDVVDTGIVEVSMMSVCISAK